MRLLSLIAGAMMAVTAGTVGAQVGGPSNDTFKAVMLYSACTHPPGETPEVHEFAEQTCSSYIRGLTDGLYLMQTLAEKHKTTCMPDDTPVSNGEARHVFENWLKAHPETAQNSAGVVAAFAIINSYPCGP